MQSKYGSQISSKLITDTVFNVVETEETLTTLSRDEVGAIRGGLKIKRSDLLGELPQENKLKI